MWWMAGTDLTHDAGRELARNKLQPLMPISQFPPVQTHCNNILPNYTWNHHHHHHPVSGFKRETHAHSVALVSTRWNPTPEQLQGLEELYRRGTRTPSAEQIQHIASRLRRFGKIEGKNVFYWFQNHKARERQKKRRQLETHSSVAGLGRRSYLDHKKLATPSNCTTPPPQEEESESMHGSVIAEREKDVWAQSNQKELQLDEITSWKLDSSHFNTTSTTCPPGQENANDHDVVVGAKRNPTLELFPIRTRDDSNNPGSQSGDRHDDVWGVKSRLNHHEFIEFLPIKKYM